MCEKEGVEEGGKERGVEREKMEGRKLLKWRETVGSISEERGGQKDGSGHTHPLAH